MSRARFVLALALFIGAGVVYAGQDPQYRTGTHTVPIYATVLDAEGRLVPDLTRDDFEVFDNGRQQPLTLFVNDVQPITVVMMLDRSGSMQPNFGLVEEAAAEFVQRLAPDDRARIGSFSERIQIDPATFTSDRDTLLGIIRYDLQQVGPTPLWNASVAAMTALSGQPGRRVVLIFTDGRDAPLTSRPNVTFAEARRRAEAEDVMVYAIGLVNECPPTPMPAHVSVEPTARAAYASAVAASFDDAQARGGGQRGGGQGRGGGGRGPGGRGGAGRGGFGRPGGLPVPLPFPGRGFPPRQPRVWEPRHAPETGCTSSRPDPDLRALADVGGGGYFELRQVDDLRATFARVAHELHQQYLLAFVAAVHDGALHRVEVRVRRPGLTARARKNYQAPK